jgi:hypothetical protein
MSVDPVRAIADAVLYEGYILWPYRRSALKNQQRFTFGGVYPPAHCAEHPDDRDAMVAQTLVRPAGELRLSVTVRFLQVVERQVLRGGEPVDALQVGGRRWLSWEEAREREIGLPVLGCEQLQAGCRVPIAVAAGEELETLRDERGHEVGALRRRWAALRGGIEVRAQPAGESVLRLHVGVINTTPSPSGEPRPAVLRATFCSTHVLLRAPSGAFVSLADPPPGLAGAAAGCRNVGCWPVLVGPAGSADAVLCSPIILEDHPRIAPQSPGDMFDGGEIDQLLALNILALTEAEQGEMADSDPRGREILERVRGLGREELMALHGLVHPTASEAAP